MDAADARDDRDDRNATADDMAGMSSMEHCPHHTKSITTKPPCPASCCCAAGAALPPDLLDLPAAHPLELAARIPAPLVPPSPLLSVPTPPPRADA
ncbi:MAG: hypothetical protein AB1651_06600 [Pseudomonadota bacterium]